MPKGSDPEALDHHKILSITRMRRKKFNTFKNEKKVLSKLGKIVDKYVSAVPKSYKMVKGKAKKRYYTIKKIFNKIKQL
jgi:hypothetical protein